MTAPFGRSAFSRKRICLVIPPSAFLLDERVFVSLGILKIASSLEQQGHCVNVLDLSGIKNYLEALSTYLASGADEIVGITATTPQLPAVFEIGRADYREHGRGRFCSCRYRRGFIDELAHDVSMSLENAVLTNLDLDI